MTPHIALASAALVAAAGVAIGGWSAPRGSVGSPATQTGAETRAQPPAPSGSPQPPDNTEVRVVCGTSCHRLPPADILPKASWRDEVARMALIREGRTEPAGPPGTAARSIVLPDDMRRVLALLPGARARRPVRSEPMARGEF